MGLILGFLEFLFLDWVSLCMASNVHNYTFILNNTNFERLCNSKSMLVVNGTFPGPTIAVRKGDTAYVNVHNNGDYGVTIHWHGVKQPRNSWSDGPENITQCPIQPGKKFHSRIHGAIVILPELGTKYPFDQQPDDEVVLVLGEWYLGDVKEIIDNATETGGDPKVSDAFTINGQPGFPNNCSNETTYSVSVEHGKTYLLRIVSAVMNEEMFFGIADHNITVVGRDGAYIKPIITDYVLITPGQTMDVLLTANQTPGHYYMAATPFMDASAPYDSSNTSAILKYTGNYTAPSSPPYPSLPSVNDTVAADNFTDSVRSLASKEYPIDVPQEIDERLFITVSVNQLPCNKDSCDGPNGTMLAASLNNVSFVTPKIDILQAYYMNMQGIYNDTFPSYPPHVFNYTGISASEYLIPSTGTKVRMIDWLSKVEIVFQGTNILLAENHPMHLHGFSFYLVGSGYGNFDNVTSPKTYNLVDPPEVNTIGVPQNGWAAIRFLADNPGVWFMHCHLERHSSWGMDTVLIVRNGTTEEQSMLPPPANLPTCS
ncbi:hypothetical protein SLA2020_354020 [Shorea laevis]